jgi:aminoacrylate hydrolase
MTRPSAEILQVQMPDGAGLNVSCDGQGPAVLLISGLGGTAGFWAPIVPFLSSRYRIIRFDQRGIAGSARGTAPCTINTLAEDALHILTHLGHEKASVLGHSTGGCIVQAMARSAPSRLSHAILSATWLRAGAYMKALFELRRNLLREQPQAYARSAALLSYPPEWLEQNWSVFEKSSATYPRSEAEQAIVAERIDALLAHDGTMMVSALTMPTLILGADDDMIVPAFHQRALAAALPKSRLMMLPQGGHFFPITQTQAFVETLTQFLVEAPSS